MRESMLSSTVDGEVSKPEIYSVYEGEPTQSVYEPQPEMRQEEEC